MASPLDATLESLLLVVPSLRLAASSYLFVSASHSFSSMPLRLVIELLTGARGGTRFIAVSASVRLYVSCMSVAYIWLS